MKGTMPFQRPLVITAQCGAASGSGAPGAVGKTHAERGFVFPVKCAIAVAAASKIFIR